MVKGKQAQKKQVVVKKVMMRPTKAKRVKQVKSKAPVFGPISTIDTAPVSIGNSVSGCAPVVVPVQDGVRIKGRDFLCNISATAASVVGWTLVGGSPLVPHALVSSLLKSYAGIYAEFVIHGVAFHFITACPSSTQGDVMLMIGKSRGDSGINFSSANFMSVVLSDHNTVLGPLWQNHTSSYFPPPRIYDTDILNDEDLLHQGPGELFVFTKTSSLQVPGYILMDYDISFRTMQVNIRALTFPISRLKYNQIALALSANVTSGVTRAIATVTGTLLDNATSGSVPTGAAVGDIYKVIMNVTVATFTSVTTATLLAMPITGSSTTTYTAQTIADGYTVYGVYYATNALILYPNFAEAASQSNPYTFGVTANIAFNIPSFISLVGSTGSTGIAQSNI
jgi:hypothetical protein